MNEDAFNVSVRKFLKKVGITSQREIEKAVRAALADGRLKGHEAMPARMTLAIGAVGLAFEIDGAIELEWIERLSNPVRVSSCWKFSVRCSSLL